MNSPEATQDSQRRAGRGGPQIIPRPDDFELGGLPPWGEIPESERRASLERLREVLEAGDVGGSASGGAATDGIARDASAAGGSASDDPTADVSDAIAGGLAGNGPTGDGAAADPSRDPNAPSIPKELAQGTWRKSAVLVPLYEDKGELHVILTRRAAHLRSHSLEVSFPGGGQEEADASLWETALREAREEISLNTDLVEQIGQLPTFRTVGSKSLVHPFVSVIRGGRPEGLIPDPSEVEHILYVPMSELLRDDVFHEEHWTIPAIGHVTVNFFELYGDTVWGATAAMLRQLLALATGKETLIRSNHFWEQDR